MESWETELCNKLYKTEEEQQIFLGFRILKQEQKETTNKAKYFWIFQISNQSYKTKKANNKKQRKYFRCFCVLESRNKNKNNREKEAKHGYTKYRQNMICR
jgi:hypothetical protein